MNSYVKNWQMSLNENDWNDFLVYSNSDICCNRLWLEYKSGNVSYEEVSRYEFGLFLQYSRNKKLKLLLNN